MEVLVYPTTCKIVLFFYGFTTLVCIRDCQHFLFDLCNFTNYITNTNCAQLSSVSIVLLGASWLGFCFYSLLTYIQSGKLFIELYQLLNATIYIKPIWFTLLLIMVNNFPLTLPFHALQHWVNILKYSWAGSLETDEWIEYQRYTMKHY